MLNFVIAQVPVQVHSENELRVLDLLMKGGWVMLPILALSLIGMYVFIERLIAVKRADDKIDIFLQVKNHILEGRLDSAGAICRQNSSVLSKMLSKGISKIGSSMDEIEKSIENVGRIEVAKLEKNLPILGIVAGIAPMFGFLGTISGVIRIFYQISLENNINIGTISGGLYEKMITSAAGLLVGILAYIGHHIINMMIDRVVLNTEVKTMEFIEMLEDPSK